VADETLVPWTDYESDPGYKDLPVQEKIGLFKEWRDATVDRSMALGLVTTQEDENYLNDYLEKAYDGILDTQSKTDVLKNAAARSLLNTEQAALVASIASGFLDPKNEASVKLAEINKQLESYPSSSMVRKIGSDKVGVWEGLTKSPIALAELLIENLPAQFATAALADAAGTAVGAAVAGPGGAVVGGTAGMATGAGGQSLMLEYSGSLLEQLSEGGVDLDDPAQIRDAFENKELMAKVNEKALKKGVPPGLFDAASAVLAKALGGKFAAALKVSKGFTPTVKLLAKEAIKDTTLQAGLGMAGEAGGQLLSEGKITSANQVALEGVLEVPGSAYGFARGFGAEGLKAVADKLSQDPIADIRARDLSERMQADGTIPEVENLANAGAPQTAAAVAQASAASANQDLDQLDLDMNKAQAAKVFGSEQPATPEAEAPGVSPEVESAAPTAETPMDAQNSLEAAKVWGRIRSRQPVRGEDIERFGFVLPQQWLLNPETGDYEFKAEANETEKPAEISIQEATTPTTQEGVPETATAQAQAVAPMPTAQPEPAQESSEAVSAPLEEKTQEPPAPLKPDAPMEERKARARAMWAAAKPGDVYTAEGGMEGEKLTVIIKVNKDGTRYAELVTEQGEYVDTVSIDREGSDVTKGAGLIYGADMVAVKPKNQQTQTKPQKIESPKAKETALPKWEEVQKNKNQIRFLRSTLSKVNKALPEDQRIEEKTGWKRGDYLTALETQYGKVAGLEKNIDAVPGKVDETNPLEAMNSDEKRRAKKKANLRQKLYSVRDSKLNEGQQSWKEIAFSNIRRIAKEVSERYTNIPNVDDYIFDDLLRKVANYLQKKNTFTEEELTAEAISPILASWAEDSAKDARGSADIQALMRNSPILDQTETSDRPARTQTELDEEEKAAGETKQARVESGANEPRASRILRDNGYNPAREKLGPDQKLILDWLVHKLSGGPTPSGIETKNLQSYEDLAKFLSELNKKKVTAKAVSKMAKEAQTALAAELNNSGIGVSTDQISTALTPEGEKARTRAKEKAEAKEKVKKDKAEAQDLADRGRNATQNQYLAEKLIDAAYNSTPEQRSRLASEVLTPLEEGNLEEASVEQRLENIKKGQPNETIVTQPEPSKPVSRRRRRTGVREQPGVQQPSGSGVTQQRGTPASVGSSQSEGETNTDSGSRTRAGRGKPGVGKEQPATAGNVPSLKVDSGFENLNISKAARAALNDLFNTLRAIRFPGTLKVGQTDNPVYVLKSDRQGLSIYVSPEALLNQKRQLIRKFGKEEGAKRWVNWQLMAVATHETVHNVHLKQLEKEANELGLTFEQHLKNEAKRVARLLNKNRRLKKLVARLYNNDEGKFANDEQQYFEFIRMMVENETVGSVTEDNTISTEELADYMDDIERKSLSDFIDSIIQAITNIAARLVGVRDNDARYLLNTTRLLRQRSLNILRPPMQEKAGNAYVEPKKTEGKSKVEKPAVTPEVENSGLYTAKKEFLQEYAKELGIKVPTSKITGVRFNPKTKKSEEFKTYVPTWNKAQYVEAIQAKLKELGQKAKSERTGVIGASPMRFKTEYAFRQIDQSFGSKKGIFKGLTVDSDNTLPWENLKAKILKGTSQAEANWVLPTMEALVRNGRVDVDQAVNAMKALANSKVEVDYLTKNRTTDSERRLSVRYSEINPKPVKEMQNLREILVRAPGVTTWQGHYPEKDVIGFGRMYSTSQGEKTGTFVFEVQSDVNDKRFDLNSDPEATVYKVSATEKNLLQALAPEFGGSLQVSPRSFNAYAEEDFVPEGYRDDMGESDRILKGDILVGGVEEPPSVVARKVGENLYHVFGLYALDLKRLIENNGGGLAEITEDITPKPIGNISEDLKRKEQLEKNKSLVDAHESLVLKAAIADAIANGEDFIAITDAETAAMTEGHRDVKEGMRVHYGTANGSLHNLARKLTGDTGTPFNDGPSSYAFNEEEADRTETPPELNRYPKKDVTGVSYSLDKVKALGEDSDIYNILGAAVPTDRPSWMTKDGEVLEVPEEAFIDLNAIGTHAETAIEWLNENQPKDPFLLEWRLVDTYSKKEQQERPVEEMLRRGWLRVVGDGFNLYFEGSPNKEQLDKLLEAAIEDEVKLIQDLTSISGRPRSKVVYEPPQSDVIGAPAMPRRGFLSNQRNGSQKKMNLPDSIDELAFEREMPGGSHPVAVYQDIDGNRFIVKTDQSREQFENEVAAENVYRVLNYPVADSKLIEVEGKPAKIAAYLADGQSLREFRETHQNKPELIKKIYDQIADGLLIDAFLFNYDSVGVTHQDNVLIQMTETPNEDGDDIDTIYTTYRVDSGGTFDTKAFEEEPRNEPFYYDSIKVFKQNYPYLNLTTDDLIAQLSDLVLNADAIINAVPKRLQQYMGNRLQYMADQLSAVDIITPVTGVTEKQTEEFFERLRSQMAAVEVTRNNRGNLINKATGKESMVSGMGSKVVPKSEFRYRLERTPLFKAWFGDWENAPESRATSKILDESGEPALMYHGTGSYLQKYSDLYKDELTNAIKTPSYLRRLAMNRFKGVWTSTIREWAERWATKNNPEGHFEGQVVIPMYVKSTKPFDPRSPENINQLLEVVKGQGYTPDPEVEFAFKSGLHDWQIFEGKLDYRREDGSLTGARNMPDVDELRKQGVSEETIKKMWGKTYGYPSLKNIIDLGYDGVWLKEGRDSEASLVIDAARKLMADQTDAKLKADYDAALAKYNENSAWNFLAFRRDGVKNAMNSGRFSSIQEPGELKKSQLAQKLEGLVTKDGATGRNVLRYKGQTMYSTDSAAALASYAVASDSALNRHNIAKIKFKGQPNTFIFQRRTAPSATSDRAYPVNDILGAAEVRPRRFGVKVEKYVSKDVMGLLKKRNYEVMPDSVTIEEAQTYYTKHGLEKSALASLMDDEDDPIQAGAQEALGMLVIKGYREEAKTRPEAATEMASFLDQFLERSTKTARALRAYQFISLLGPEGMEALYYKKARKRDAVMRESFKEFIKKAQEKLNPLAQDALEKVLKDLEQVISKATSLSKSNNKKIAAKTTMTLWQQFSESVAKRMTDSVNERLAAIAPQEGEGEGDAVTVAGSTNKPKTINQEATAALRRIKGMVDNLAKEQGRAIRDVEVEGNPENENASNEQIEDLIRLKQKAKTISKLSDLLALWPKALQAWSQIKDSIREEVAVNPKLAPIFDEYLKTAVDQPFTLPQIKTLLKASDIDLKSLIREHFRKNTMQKQSTDLARLFIEQANLGEIFSRTSESSVLQAQGADAEASAGVDVSPSIAEKLETAIGKRIEELVNAEALKSLTNLIKSQADKRLEPSLKRFLDRLVKATSLGLLDKDNIDLWSQFSQQEGLNDPKLAEEVYELAKQAETKPEGYQRNMYYQKAMRAIYENTEMNKWDFTLTYWYSSILSGWDTQLANFYGNASVAFCVLLPELFYSSITGKASAEKRSALLRGIGIGFSDFVNIMQTGSSWTKQVQLSVTNLKATDTGEVLRERGKGLPQKLGYYSTTVSRIMSAVDSVFYNMNKEYYLYKYAYDKALELGLNKKDASAQALASALRDSNSMKSAQSDALMEGLKPGTKEFKLRTFEILDQQLGQNKTESGESRNIDTQELLNESVLSALTNTFQQEPKGFLGNVIHSLNVLAAKQPQTRFVVPFTRIVGNVWNMSLDMSVVPGLIRYYGLPTEKLIGRRLGKWDDVKGAEREMIRGRALAGLLFLTAAAGLQALGYDKDYEKAWWRINGSGPDNPAAKLALAKTGWKPWSLKIGNTYFSYLPTPLAMPLALLGELTDNYHYKKTGAKALFSTGSAVVTRALLVPFDMLFLSGLSDFFKSTDSSQPEQAAARAKAFVSRLGSSFVVPNFVRDINTRLVPAILNGIGIETDLNNRRAKTGLIEGIFIANTPVLREMFGKQDVDLLGNKIPITSRIASTRKPDPLIDALALKNAFPNPPRRELLLGMIPMEEEQYYQYKVDRGTMLNQVLNTPEMVEKIRESSPYIAQEIVKKVTSSATEYAKNMAVKRMVDSNDERIQKLQTLGEWLQEQKD
jgi:hypothetical protein